MQRNCCVSLWRKSRRDHYSNVNEKNVCANRKYWKVVKLLLSGNIVSNEKITLVEREEIIKKNQANARVFNNFFSNIIANLDIPQYNQIDPICQNIKDPAINAIIKCRNRPSIIAIKERCTNSKFNFSFIGKNNILKRN